MYILYMTVFLVTISEYLIMVFFIIDHIIWLNLYHSFVCIFIIALEIIIILYLYEF